MTDLITEARELCEKATPGPWMGLRAAYEDCLLIKCDKDEYLMSQHDVAFIARSRTLIPELCDALEKAQAEIGRQKAYVQIAEINNEVLRKAIEGAEAQGWIPVTERLPEPETNVLICQHYHEDAPYAKITIGHLHQDGDLRHKPYWNWIAHGADMVHPKIEAYHRAEFICPGKEFVTHWMPLPAPPEEGGTT